MARRDLIDRLPERQLDPSLATRTYVARKSGAYGGTRRTNAASTRGGAGGAGGGALPSAGSTQKVSTLPTDPESVVTGTIYHVQGTDGEDDRLVYAIRKADGTLEYREVTQREEQWNALYITEWGSQGLSDGQFDVAVRDVAVFLDTGDVYVSSDDRIQRFSANGTYLSTPGSSVSPVPVDDPWGLTFRATLHPHVVLSTDAGAHVYGWVAAGWASTVWPAAGWSAGMRGIAFGGSLPWVAESDNHLIRSGLGDTYGVHGDGIGEFEAPVGIAALDVARNRVRLFVADSGNNRVQVFDVIDSTTTPVFTPAFTIGNTGSAKGQFKAPMGIALDSRGNIYVTDFGNNRIQVFDPNGVFLGQWGKFGDGDGEFNGPTGIAITDDYIYVADSGNYRVQMFTNPVAPTVGDLVYVAKQATAGVGNSSTTTRATTCEINTYTDVDGTPDALVLPRGTWEYTIVYTQSFMATTVATWGVVGRFNGTIGPVGSFSVADLGGSRASLSGMHAGELVSDGVNATSIRAEYVRNGSFAGTPSTESGWMTVMFRKVA